MIPKFLSKTSPKKIFFWNAAGSLFNALFTAIVLMIVNRAYDEVRGGIVTISLALAQQMLTVANFETGTYYVTDGKKKFDFSIHFAAKVLLFAVAMAISVGVAVLKYDAYKASVVIAFCVYKVTDGFSTLSAGALQREDRLDLAGMSLAAKTLGAVILLTGFTLVSHNLLLAAWSIAIFSVFWTVLVDMGLTASFLPLRPAFCFRKIGQLLLECAPLFLSTFILTYIANQPKYVIDSLLSEQTQNAFGILFMPSAVICMLGIFVYRPLLTGLTWRWASKDLKGFARQVWMVCGVLAGLMAICLAGAALLGIPFLELFFGVPLDGQRGNLCLILAGGGFYALANWLYNVLVIFRKQRWMLGAYFLAYGVCLLITKPLVAAWGIKGASLSYLVSNLFLAVLLAGICVVVFEKRKRTLQKTEK